MLEPSSPNKYAEISRRLIRQADDELAKGDLIQTSDKIWGAVAHAVKAVAEQRGWRHNNHSLLFAVVAQLSDETGRPDLRNMFRSAIAMHQNFYEDWMAVSDVQAGLENAKAHLPDLEAMRTSPPPAFTPQTQEQAARLRRLIES